MRQAGVRLDTSFEHGADVDVRLESACLADADLWPGVAVPIAFAASTAVLMIVAVNNAVCVDACLTTSSHT